ncbi:hypothetical protein K443DRAFT_646874 [Laccaria amethystina LaAM-08-1]|uniref:Unplaced genomic scaffold K443scaffold_328, whole genome shotgun sequence n=1 Tax=Laccaria amethystina LaAM-08-1 TaxID=1095629 RepID=A0A0C9WIL2_9AGAR|nr:hypothetical protein K443DRAFT_646874 [Laccaria amethystina LaAM-08-1]
MISLEIMVSQENQRPAEQSCDKRPSQTVDVLQQGPRKKPHFGRTIHALCNVHALIEQGIGCMLRLSENPNEIFTLQERREHEVFLALLRAVPGFEERLMTCSDEEVNSMAGMLQKGASSTRSDDTKSLKSAIIDWLTPPGEALIPPIARNMKVDRGYHHEKTGVLLCPTGVDWSDIKIKQKLRTGEFTVRGDQWLIFLWSGYKYDEDQPWRGLLRSDILVKSFKHIFTSPSSVEKEAKATRSGNARLHGMTSVTPASVAYVATQARFALSSLPVFTHSDKVTDSELFYNSILNLLEDPDERTEVGDLISWWNRQIFPNYAASSHPVSKNSALAKIKAKRAVEKSALGDQNLNA